MILGPRWSKRCTRTVELLVGPLAENADGLALHVVHEYFRIDAPVIVEIDTEVKPLADQIRRHLTRTSSN